MTKNIHKVAKQHFLPQSPNANRQKRTVCSGVEWSGMSFGYSQLLCRDTLYAAKWNQLISFRKHLPAAWAAAITNMNSPFLGRRWLSSQKYETPAGLKCGEWQVAGCHLALSEMFQKLQLAAMKNDKFHFVATVTQTQAQAQSPKLETRNSTPPTDWQTPRSTLPFATYCAAFALLALFYYLSSLLRKQQAVSQPSSHSASQPTRQSGRQGETFKCNCAAATFWNCPRPTLSGAFARFSLPPGLILKNYCFLWNSVINYS